MCVHWCVLILCVFYACVYVCIFVCACVVCVCVFVCVEYVCVHCCDLDPQNGCVCVNHCVATLVEPVSALES